MCGLPGMTQEKISAELGAGDAGRRIANGGHYPDFMTTNFALLAYGSDFVLMAEIVSPGFACAILANSALTSSEATVTLL